jgi:hypothetical protein
MRCDICLDEAIVHIPTVGAWCSAHALAFLGTWPQRRYRELVSQLKAAA